MSLPSSPSTIYRDRLAQETGLTPRDIINETWIRAAILKTLDEKGYPYHQRSLHFLPLLRLKSQRSHGQNRP